MSVDIHVDATPDLLLLIQQKLHIVQYRYGSLSQASANLSHSPNPNPNHTNPNSNHKLFLSLPSLLPDHILGQTLNVAVKRPAFEVSVVKSENKY